MERLTIDELIKHCNRQLAKTPSGNIVYQEHESVRAYLQILRHYMNTLMSPERVAELAQADQDGRLVVLPCKVGNMVYEVEPLWLATICDKDTKCRSCKDFYEGGMGDTPCCLRGSRECITISEKTATLSMIAEWIEQECFGKTVFLTRQEAEEALERMKEAASI